MNVRPPTGTRARFAVLALLTAFCGSCASESITAPSGSLLTLSTPTRSVSVNGTAVFTAELLNGSGQPMVGASVTFTTTLGTVDPAQAVTNGSGQVTAVFSAGTASGTAVIGASSGSIRATPVSLVVGTAAVGRVAMSASPTSVPFGGGQSAITAVVTDAAGNPLKSMPVGFSTTAGNLTPANAKTDTNGIVQTTLTTTAAAIVTAVAGSSPVSTGPTTLASLTGSVTVSMAPRPSPAVTIQASPNPVAGTAVTFTLGATPAPGTNTTIQNVSVTFGDGAKSDLGAVSGAAIVVQHVYIVGGTYTVSMTATDSGGGSATATTVLVVKATAPLSVAIAAGPMVPAGGGPNSIVSFAATVVPATAIIQSYLWDFGDGSAPQQTTGNQVQHVFASTGIYTVKVTVTEAITGLTGQGSVLVSTTSGMPNVSILAGPNPVAGRPTTFTISAAVAAAVSARLQSVRVTFGDGTPPTDLGGVSGSGIGVGHVFAAPGTYLVSVTATDNAGGTATASTQVVVAAAQRPSVSVTVGANPIAGTATTFTVTAAPAEGSDSTIQNVQVAFGDGTAPVDLGAINGTAMTQHVYTAGGSYTISATVTDSGGLTATASTQAVVSASGAPTVSVTASANPIANTATTFTITSAPAPGSGTTVQNVRVTFGDGSAADLGAVSSPTTTQHAFAAAGTYTVTVTATATNGVSATASVQVVVTPPPANSPSVSVTASASPVAGNPVTFTITAAPAPGSSTTITNVQVNFGDGTPVVNLGAVSSPTTTQHAFANANSYTVSATATASNGVSATAFTQVVVAAPGAPSVSLTASANPVPGAAVTFTITTAPAPGTNTTITNVQVNFGDGSPVVNLGAVSSPATTQHVFANANSYTVSAIATASNNVTATATTQVVVAAPGAPTLSVTATSNAIVGSPVTFTVTAAAAPGSNTTVAGVGVTFGDGSVPVDLGAVNGTVTTQHAYGAAGTYTVAATATSSSGSATTTTIQVVVAPRPTPSVSISASANPVTLRPVTFSLNVQLAPGGNASIQSVVVNFGDGSSLDMGAVSGMFTVQHTYSVAAPYAVSATATDIAGASATGNTSLTVVEAATVTLVVSASPMINSPTQFTVTVTPAIGVSVQNVTLNYGDGSQDNLGAVSGTPVTRLHTYATSGIKPFVVTVALVDFPTALTVPRNVTVAPCPALSITHTVTSTLSGLLYAWPGGNTTLTSAACSVQVSAPSGLISNLSGDTWVIVGRSGFSSCTLTPRVPTCNGPSSSSDLLGNGRPYCSNSALGGGASTAGVLVSCVSP